ncbi:MAG: PilW family protein [Gammaproteobacteria bacterium]
MKKQYGYNLIEIMIALLLGLFVIGSTLTIYISTVRGSSDTVKAARLNHDLEAVMALMINDIRRAGYWGGARVGVNSNDNPFTGETGDMTNIKVRDLAAPTTDITSGNCILYSYDADGDGIIDDNEHYGFRLNGNTINMRFSGAAAAPATCDWANGTWEENIAGDQIRITGLTFDLSGSKCENVTTSTAFNSTCADVPATDPATGTTNLNSGNQVVETRQVSITMTGQLADDATVTKSLTDIVKVRNDRVFIQP